MCHLHDISPIETMIYLRNHRMNSPSPTWLRYELHPLSNNDMFQRNGIVVPDPGAPPGATLKFRIYQLDETYCR